MTPVASERWSTGDDEEREGALAAATLAVGRGQLVVIPTDTVYGVGCDAFDPAAVRALLAAKGRGPSMPPPVLIGQVSTFDALVTKIPDYARTLAEEFWPGPLTMVGFQQPSLTWDLGETRGTVAVRVPDDEVARAVLERTGPLAVSSANVHGQPAATTADEAAEMLAEKVAVIVDGGTSRGGVASTILDITRDRPRLLREGSISVADLDAVLADHAVTVEE